MVSHASQGGDHGDLFWVTAASAFNLRTLQQTGYFTKGKVQTGSKIPNKLTPDEKLIARVLSRLLQSMRFNTHGILELVSSGGKSDPVRNPQVRKDARRNRICELSNLFQ